LEQKMSVPVPVESWHALDGDWQEYLWFPLPGEPVAQQASDPGHTLPLDGGQSSAPVPVPTSTTCPLSIMPPPESCLTTLTSSWMLASLPPPELPPPELEPETSGAAS
jgi:hypothetical protein